MRAMIIGLSTLALAALPTLAVADGDGALTGAAGGAVAGAVVGGPVGAAVGGVAGGVIGGAASDPRPVVVAPPPGASRATANNNHHKTTIRARASRDRRPIVPIEACPRRSAPGSLRREQRIWPRGGLRRGARLC